MSTFSWRVLRLPLLITLLWGLLLFTLFRWTAQREDEYTTGLARIQTATLFSSIVDTRDWNANNGGVWVREHPGCPANPSATAAPAVSQPVEESASQSRRRRTCARLRRRAS